MNAMTQQEQWITVARREDLWEGGMLAVTVDHRPIALYDVGGQLFATDNECTHALALLTDGWLEGDVVECPLHGGKFSVRTGEGLCAPVTCGVRTYEVRCEGGQIQLKLPSIHEEGTP